MTQRCSKRCCSLLFNVIYTANSFRYIQLYWRDAVDIVRDGSLTRLHARRQFHKRPRYDLVQVFSGDGQPWFGRLMGLFDVPQGAGWRAMALVHWLTEIDSEDTHVPGATTYRQEAEVAPDVIEIESIECSVRMLTSVLDRAYFVRTKYNVTL